MNNEFVGFEEAVILKQIGFDESCLAIYDKGQLKLLGGVQRRNSTYPDVVTAPLIQQAFSWLRRSYGLYAEIQVDKTLEPMFCYSISKYTDDGIETWWEDLTNREEFFMEYAYEKAEYECLKKMLGIVKNILYIS